MFGSFFYLLRARNMNVTLSEWLTLTEAMDKGLARANLTHFYYLARSILVKSEVDFDKFDNVFLEFFKNVVPGATEDDPYAVSAEMTQWLDSPAMQKKGGDTGRGNLFRSLSDETVAAMFKDRLQGQKEEHNGGIYWIGTDGASPFGNDGESQGGIRVGGVSQKRIAMAVAGERRFRDFRGDAVLNTRNFQLAFRRLRQLSNRENIPRTELNVNETIRQTCDRCGNLRLAFDRPRKNKVKLLLMMDSGGSMEGYAGMCAALFQAVSKANHFKDLKVYYFHNCIKSLLYKTPAIEHAESVKTDWVLRNLDGTYTVIIVGDALMNAGELTGGGYYAVGHGSLNGLQWLRRFKHQYKRLVWLTPSEPSETLVNGYWGKSYRLIHNEVPMDVLTVETLSNTIKKLMVSR